MTDQLDLTDLRSELDSAGISDLDGLLRRLRADGVGANRPPKRSSPTRIPERCQPPDHSRCIHPPWI